MAGLQTGSVNLAPVDCAEPHFISFSAICGGEARPARSLGMELRAFSVAPKVAWQVRRPLLRALRFLCVKSSLLKWPPPLPALPPCFLCLTDCSNPLVNSPNTSTIKIFNILVDKRLNLRLS